jgi:hypothetical protein
MLGAAEVKGRPSFFSRISRYFEVDASIRRISG